MADLKGKVAVVTGAARGLGRGVAEGLAEAGATIYVAGDPGKPDAAPPAATAAAVEALGGVAIAVPMDPADADQVRVLFERVEREQGRLDVLVNNLFPMLDVAGCGSHPPTRADGFWERGLSAWDDPCGVALKAYYVASVYATPLMVRQNRGLIVNLSADGTGGHPLGVAYGVGLCAVDRMAQDMAVELDVHNVAALSLWPERGGRIGASDISAGTGTGGASPRFTGRCVAALAMDPDVMEKSGGTYLVTDLAEEYRFTDMVGGHS